MRLDGRWEVADTAAVASRIAGLRAAAAPPFELAVPGETAGTDPGRRQRYAAHRDAGATWWVEAVHPWRYGWTEGAPWPLAAMRERIEAGP
jgi:hypothetical protein